MLQKRILIPHDPRFLCDIAALLRMSSLAVATDLGSLGTTLHILTSDLESSRINGRDCRILEKESSNCLPYQILRTWGQKAK